MLRKIRKSFLHMFHLGGVGYLVKNEIKWYKNDKYGNMLAYYLTHIDAKNFENRQKQLLFSILKYAKENVPYYSSIMNNTNLNKFQTVAYLKKLPLLSKEIIRVQGDMIYSKRYKKIVSYWMNTGGSTGEPLRFPVSDNFEHVHARCLYTVMGGTKRDKIVSIDGTRIDEKLLQKNIFWKEGTNNFPYGSVHYSTLYMNDSNLLVYIDHLNLIKPAIMRGYPSGFEYLAKHMIKKNILLNFKLKGIYLTSEYFDTSTIEFLAGCFKCPIYGQYGHSEVSIYAFTLANNTEYLCSPIYGYTEILNEAGDHVKENELGEIVVTGFSNKAMPFIRYKTGDMAVYGGTKNGVVKIKSLQGRSVDFILTSENKKIFLTGLIFGGHLKSFEKIKSWQIEQNEPGLLSIKIIQDIGYSSLCESELVQLFNSVGVKIELNYVNEIPLTIRGKRRFLIQNVL